MVMTIRLKLYWCSGSLESACQNGEFVRGAFFINAHDRDYIAWSALADAGISGLDVRDREAFLL